jgi:hypothetical protein
LSAFSIAPLALSWASVLAKRALMELPSRLTTSGATPAALSASCTRLTVPKSSAVETLAADTCTAGDSPNRLGSAYRPPISIAITKIAYFQRE